MKLTIQDLIPIVEFSDVMESMKFIHHNHGCKGNYRGLIKDLVSRKRIPHKDPKEFIVIKLIGFNELKKDPDDRFYSMMTNKYSMSLRDWNELVNIPISHDTLKHYRAEEIVAMFLWEITFYGNERQMKKKGKDLKEAVDDIKKNPGRLKTFPLINDRPTEKSK